MQEEKECLNESKGMRAQGGEQLAFENLARRIERQVEAGNARVGRGQVLVVGRAHGDRRGGHECLFAGRQHSTRRPKVELDWQRFIIQPGSNVRFLVKCWLI